MKASLRAALDGRRPKTAAAPGFADCAVLVPLIHTDSGPRLLFMERAAVAVDPHGGQISFPGGRREAQDADEVQTALRETEEEIGLPRASVEVLGRLDDTLVPTGYRITPIVGWVSQLPALNPDPRECAGCFQVPLDAFAPERRKVRGAREIGGKPFEVSEYHADGRVIWGATARIVECLFEAAGWPAAASKSR